MLLHRLTLPPFFFLPFSGPFRMKRKSTSSPSPHPKKRKKKKSGRRRSRWVEAAPPKDASSSFFFSRLADRIITHGAITLYGFVEWNPNCFSVNIANESSDTITVEVEVGSNGTNMRIAPFFFFWQCQPRRKGGKKNLSAAWDSGVIPASLTFSSSTGLAAPRPLAERRRRRVGRNTSETGECVQGVISHISNKQESLDS